jgi:hypothetical protein
MNTTRAAIAGVVTVLLATPAFAQAPGSGAAGQIASMGGQSVAQGPRVQQPTPLFMLGGLVVGIWTRVPLPYDAAANRNGAANPLP